MSKIGTHWRTTLLVLIGLHLGLACWYASVTPYRASGFVLSQRDPRTHQPLTVIDVGAPDERQHANYVEHLLMGEGFPILVWEVPDPAHPGQTMRNPNLGETYQSHQPPLYYLLEAGWAKLTGASPIDPQSGPRLRLLNALIGCLGVAGTFFLGRWAFDSAEIGLIAAALPALLPMNGALSGALSNDPLLIALCTWTLAVCALAMTKGWTWKLAAVVGVLAGLAFLTKTTALGLAPALLVAALAKQVQRPKVGQVALCAAVAICVALPWWIRNQHLYGDPFAISAFNQAFVGSPQAKDLIGVLGPATYWLDWVGWWTARSFFGAFGNMDIWLNETGLPAAPTPNTLYRLLLAGFALLLIGWAVGRSKGAYKERSGAQLMNEVFILVTLVLFLRFNAQYFQAQARYILPAIGPLGCLLALGALQLFKQRAAAAFAVVSCVLLALNLYALNRLPQEFAKRTRADAVGSQRILGYYG